MRTTSPRRMLSATTALMLGLGSALAQDASIPVRAQAQNPSKTQVEGTAPGSGASVIERLKAAELESANMQRAINLARNTAVTLNGGLGSYQPGPCMVEARRAKQCLIGRGPEGFVFRFPGGPPGWVAEGKPATVETEISIAPDGRSVLKTIYNGAPSQSGAASVAPAQPCPCVCPAAPAKPAS